MMEKQGSILKEKKLNEQQMLNLQPSIYLSNRNLQKLQLTLFDKTKRHIYIYIYIYYRYIYKVYI